MNSRRYFLEQGSLGFLAALALPVSAFAGDELAFEGLIINDQEGEAVRMRTAVVKIKMAKTQGAQSMCFLSESFMPGDALPVHKHSNEDELVFCTKALGCTP